MSRFGYYSNGSPLVGQVQTLTGNTGGAVSGDGAFNITIVGEGGFVVTGTPGDNTLTFTNSALPESTTYVDTASYDVLTSDVNLLVDTEDIGTSSGQTLPTALFNGQTFTVKDFTNDASVYHMNVSVTGEGSIDNQSIQSIRSDYGAQTYAAYLQGDTQNYYVIGENGDKSNINLPATTSTPYGNFFIADQNVIINDGSNNFFMGPLTGVIGNPGGGGQLTAFGSQTLPSINQYSLQHTAFGPGALYSSLGAGFNTAFGYASFSTLTASNDNIGVGYNSGAKVTDGPDASPIENIALGVNSCAGLAPFTGVLFSDIAIGSNSLANIQGMAWYNVAIGYGSGNNYLLDESSNILINNPGVTTEVNVCRIGAGTGTDPQELNATYIGGIQGVVVTGVPVLVSSSDQLGVTLSSKRFKDNIVDMDNVSTDILNLRPVTFNYKEDSSECIQHGLIAEEVQSVNESLVVFDKEGLPLTVKYQDLVPYLLHELKNAINRVTILENQYVERNSF